MRRECQQLGVSCVEQYVVPVAARFVFEGDDRDGAEGSITHAVEGASSAVPIRMRE